MSATHMPEGFLRRLVSIVLAVFALAAIPVYATTTLTLAHIYSPDHPTAKSCQYFADTLNARSKGRILVKLYNEASMGNQTAILRSLKNGSLDLSVLSHGVVSGIVPEFNALGLPYLFPDPATAWRVLDGPVGQQLMQKSAAKGLVVLSFWDMDIRHLSNSIRPILRPADLAGLRIRIPPDPLAAEIVTALGAKAQEINFSDLYKALQQGVVDGQDNPLINFKAARLYDVQKFISLTGHKYAIHTFLMSKVAWDVLPAGDREIVLAVAKETVRYQRELVRDAEVEANRDLLARGVKINKVDIKPFSDATVPIYDKWYASPIGDFVRSVVQAVQAK
ncbi:MAG: TRAP transporter substrate-binding protein [Betaproteobacteria bacterium]